jgi:hypothetical protein
MKTKPSRDELVAAIVARDGLMCAYTGEEHPLDLGGTGQNEVTIDHWMPMVWCKAQGWSYDEMWDVSNLRLMCKKHNSRKGDSVPRRDGTLPEKVSRFKYRRQKRAERPEICISCTSGRDLGPDEVCASCGSGPMPHRWPRWAKVRSSECLHDGIFWCWACASGLVEMRGATETIMYGGEGGE